MEEKVFVPLTDELLFDHPELISAPLRPYTQDVACYHWLEISINPGDEASATPGANQLSDKQHRDIAKRLSDIRYPELEAA